VKDPQERPDLLPFRDRVSQGFIGWGPSGARPRGVVIQQADRVPHLDKRVFGDPGRSRRKTPACNGPISVRDADAARTDADNLNAAVKGTAAEPFISAASPGVISLFFRNDHYKDQEAYLYAIAEAMRHEYETVAKAGIILQIDCPDLGMGRHIQYADLSLAEFRKRARMHVEALNHALANIPAEQLRIHLCWGNYEGPHHCDVPLADIIDIVFLAKPHAISLEAANPRHAHEWQLFERVRLPEGKVVIPGVIESKSNGEVVSVRKDGTGCAVASKHASLENSTPYFRRFKTTSAVPAAAADTVYLSSSPESANGRF
jgi:5-methyltetrahydropteroyltriglutamate--homocysteine methyltransferase